jgi:hypothetical protein
MFTLSPKQKSALARIGAGLPKGTQHIALNPADRSHRAVIDTFLDLANKGADRFPALHRSLEKQAKSGKARRPD